MYKDGSMGKKQVKILTATAGCKMKYEFYFSCQHQCTSQIKVF